MNAPREGVRINRRKFLELAAGAGAIAAGGVGLPLTSRASPKGSPKRKILVSTYSNLDEFTSAQNAMINWFGQDHGIDVFLAPTGTDPSGATQVKNALGILKTTAIDGILLCSPAAKPEKAITDYAKSRHIPVIGFQELTDSPDVLMYVGTLPNIQGELGGEAMKQALKLKFGAVKGKVFVVTTTPASVTHYARTLGFLSVLKREPNVKVTVVETANITTQEAKEKVETYLKLGNNFDAAWGPSGAMPEGIIQGIKDFYNGHFPEDKVVVGSEAYTTVLQGIRDGYVTAATAPAAQYIGVIAFQYLLDYLDGKPLPSVGSTVTRFSIAGKPRKGFNPWDSGYIASAVLPAKVTTLQQAIDGNAAMKSSYRYDYPVWLINIPIITKKNVDARWIWGNFPYNWAVEVR